MLVTKFIYSTKKVIFLQDALNEGQNYTERIEYERSLSSPLLDTQFIGGDDADDFDEEHDLGNVQDEKGQLFAMAKLLTLLEVNLRF